MKQFYVIFLLLSMYFIADAQIKKGDVILGGNLGYSNQSQTSYPVTSKNSSLNINPSVGKAIRDNLVLGIDIGYTHSTSDQTPAGTGSSSQAANGFTAGIFVRRYKPIGAGFSLFGNAEVSGNYSHSNYVAPSTGIVLDRYNEYGFGLSLAPGIAYALNRRWQIETSLPNLLSISYQHNNTRQEYTNSSPAEVGGHSFVISSSLTGTDEFAVGVRYIIGD